MDRFSPYLGQCSHIPRLREEFETGRMSHAYLLTGPSGTGKKSVMALLAQILFCRGEEKPCGLCPPCQRVLAGTHPDLYVLTPEEKKRDIGVGPVRSLLEKVQTRAQEGGVKVFEIPDADRMNAAAQNALLKTLEEPPEDTVFILTTSQPSKLLSTVVSRCRTIRFHPLSEEETCRRLRELGVPETEVKSRARLCEGCVGRALALQDGDLALQRTLAEECFSVRNLTDCARVMQKYKDEKERREQLLSWLEESMRETVQVQSGAAEPGDTALPAALVRYARSVPMSGGLTLMDRLRTMRKMMNSNVAFGSVLETFLLAILEEYRKWPW